MTKRIILLGLLLMAIGSPLYADISSNNDVAGANLAVRPNLQIHPAPAGQITDGLFADTPARLILDTGSPLAAWPDAVTGISGTAPDAVISASLAPVPEPTHYALMGLGFVGLYLARRDRLSAK